MWDISNNKPNSSYRKLSNAEINAEKIVRETINKVGYAADYKFTGDSCNFNSFIHEQSVDINRGVDKINSKFQGAGDQV